MQVVKCLYEIALPYILIAIRVRSESPDPPESPNNHQDGGFEDFDNDSSSSSSTDEASGILYTCHYMYVYVYRSYTVAGFLKLLCHFCLKISSEEGYNGNCCNSIFALISYITIIYKIILHTHLQTHHKLNCMYIHN